MRVYEPPAVSATFDSRALLGEALAQWTCSEHPLT
jgi:hypothetical protein